MVNNHGDRKYLIPGVVGPFQMAMNMAYKWGGKVRGSLKPSMGRLYIYHPQPLKKPFVFWVGSQNCNLHSFLGALFTYMNGELSVIHVSTYTSPMDAVRLALGKTSEVKVASRQVRKDHVNWANERSGWPISLLNNEQSRLRNKVGVEHQPVKVFLSQGPGICSELEY